MRKVGVHTSIAGGLSLSLQRAKDLGCDTLQIFSHNPRGWMIGERSRHEYDEFRRLRAEYGIFPVFIHSSYLINIASQGVDLRNKSADMISSEMDIADSMGAEYVVLHTGSASGEDLVEARKRAISCLAEVSGRGRWRSGILLENTAGERGDIASRIEEMGEILESVPGGLVRGVCIDTCHAFSAGYEMRTVRSADLMVRELARHIGIASVKLIHLNDSRGGLGSGLDRHEHLGKGKIGLTGLRHILNRPEFINVPLILETPKKEEDDDRRNLGIVRKLIDGLKK